MIRTLVSKKITGLGQREMTLETGKLATQADGAVVVKMGGAVLLATVVVKKVEEEGLGFLPLYVDYQEKFAAAGKIPGGFLRREGRLGDHEILISRLIDRVIRPLFPVGFKHEIQLNISLISADEMVPPDALAALAASAALSIAGIPFNGPISEVRVVSVNGKLIVNPTQELLDMADIDLIVGASQTHVLMVEGVMKEAQEEEIIAAIQFAHEEIKEHCNVQKELAEAVGKPLMFTINTVEDEQSDWQKKMEASIYKSIYKVAKRAIPSNKERKEAFHVIKHNYIKQLSQDQVHDIDAIDKYFHKLEKKAVRNLVLDEQIRLDGRALNEVRHITSEIDYLPAAHGSALFTRGETQSLTTVTLGSKFDEQIIDRAMEEGYNRFMLHYNFPGFSTGEVKPNRGPSRREIGHGNLAMRALKGVLPPDEENNYTIRVVSDILESNGSSSMATVCAGSLSLMDAGIPIRSHVSGIAMGLIFDAPTNKYAILSDILGDEDHLGDMDFKVTGTLKGITACQMDMKIAGISYEILKKALLQAKEGRGHIYNKMCETIQTPAQSVKAHAPRVTTLEIEKEMIGAVIGPAGKVIQELQKETGATVNIDEIDGRGIVKIFATNHAMLVSAETRIRAIIAKPEEGAIYDGKVKSILSFGAFIEFMPGKDGLLHISEVTWERIDDLEKVLEVGEILKVKLIGIDPKTGKYRLSKKVLLPKETGAPAA